MPGPLFDRIATRIAAKGPITFAEYMELALYDPDYGFFANPPVGRAAHFVTSPHVSPVFAMTLAEQVREAHSTLGAPDDFAVVELGAGDGTLARQLLEALGDLPLRYVGVEWSTHARAGFPPGVEAVATLEEVGDFPGIVLANELLDNVPFHRLRARGADIVEVFVAVADGHLVEVEREPTVAWMRAPPDTLEWPISPASMHIVEQVASRLRRGYAVFIDYGFVAGEPVEPIRGYRAQRLVEELLIEPGATDITGPVDFDAVAEAARIAGLRVHGPVPQRDALFALGYRRVLDRLRREQTDAERAGQHRRALELFSARNEAAMLVDPAGLGRLRVLACSTDDLPTPSIVAAG